MSYKILITGGTGFIGHRLVSDWCNKGYEVTAYTRRPDWVYKTWNNQVTACINLSDLSEKFDILVNLAGEGIADKRWSSRRKHQLRNSRIELSQSLADWAKNTQQNFRVVISGSAIGFYGNQNEKKLDESSPLGHGFAAELCNDWEHTALSLSDYCERLCIIRTGVVLGEHGGMLSRLWLPFKFGMGGTLGNGKQYLSWIHRNDYIEAINWLMSHSCEGVYNLSSPNPVTNSKFTRTLANLLHRPALAPMPSFVIKLLFGEMNEILLSSQKVAPKRILEDGFQFKFSNINDALKDVINKHFNNSMVIIKN